MLEDSRMLDLSIQEYSVRMKLCADWLLESLLGHQLPLAYRGHC